MKVLLLLAFAAIGKVYLWNRICCVCLSIHFWNLHQISLCLMWLAKCKVVYLWNRICCVCLSIHCWDFYPISLCLMWLAKMLVLVVRSYSWSSWWWMDQVVHTSQTRKPYTKKDGSCPRWHHSHTWPRIQHQSMVARQLDLCQRGISKACSLSSVTNEKRCNIPRVCFNLARWPWLARSVLSRQRSPGPGCLDKSNQ
jgi:hypothetical protein